MRPDKIHRKLDKLRQLGLEISQDKLRDRFKENKPVTHYDWKLTREIYPRHCFISGALILPFQAGYKGILKDEHKIFRATFEIRYPDVVWLSKEEYTFRMIKGQFIDRRSK